MRSSNYPYTQAYHQRNKAKGLCVWCGKPRDTSRSTLKCERCLDKHNAHQALSRKSRSRYADMPCRVCGAPRGRRKQFYCDAHNCHHPKAKALIVYHMTSAEYDALGAECMLCGSTARLCIDHNHKTGKVRGRLCVKCNNHLARLEAPGNWYDRARKYLSRHKGAN